MFKKNKFLAKQNEGFTMIELLVAISVFSIVIVIVSGIFITSLRSHRTSLALISANSDAQLVLEQMTRMIRKGEDFETHSIGDYPNFDFKCLQFSHESDRIVYRWNRSNRSLERSVGAVFADCADGDFHGMVSENLRVDFANFRVDRDLDHLAYYPKITILLRVGANNTQISSDKTPFTNLQTTISPRGDSRY